MISLKVKIGGGICKDARNVGRAFVGWLIGVTILCVGEIALGGERIALVIGNSDYTEITSLSNPRNDADDVAESLRALGFELYGGKVHHNLDERSLLSRTANFADTAEGAEIAFLYFAGHGMQFNGDPHLLPVDIPNSDRLSIVRREAVGLNALLDSLAGRAELTIAVFDACREIPNYKNQINRATRGAGKKAWRGLSRPSVLVDSTLIAYSGGAGQLVADGSGRNSPYTEVLLAHLTKFYLARLPFEAPVVNTDGRAVSSYQQKLALWQGVERGNSIDEYEAFILNYPDGVLSEIARRRIAKLQRTVPNLAGEPKQKSVSMMVDPGRATEQKTPAAPSKGRLTVKVEPANALVKIMNIVPRYRAGIELELNRDYDVLVTREGYSLWRKSVFLDQSDKEISVVLEPEEQSATRGSFALDVKPSSARVCFYDQSQWQCDRGYELQLGVDYPIYASASGYENYQGRARLSRDRESLEIQLLSSSSAWQLKEDRRKAFEPEMVLLRGGCFQMGSPEDEARRYDNERLQRVCVDDVYAGVYEVTFDQYDEFARATGGNLPGDQGFGRGNRPVIRVRWRDAMAYAKWLSQETGKRYRLPTEADWEYAARGGSASAYPWGDTVSDSRANCNGCGSRWDDSKTAPVGSFSPNGYGLYDTAGNVWEWTCSEYSKSYRGSERRCKATRSGRKSLRGGSWHSKPERVRSASREGYSANGRYLDVGFRLFRDVE